MPKSGYKISVIVIIFLAVTASIYAVYGKFNILNTQYNNIVLLNEQREELSDIQVLYNKIARLMRQKEDIESHIEDIKSRVSKLEYVKTYGIYFDRSRIENLVDLLTVTEGKELNSVQNQFNELMNNYIDIVDDNIQLYHHKNNAHNNIMIYTMLVLLSCCILMFTLLFFRKNLTASLEEEVLPVVSSDEHIMKSIDTLSKKIEGFISTGKNNILAAADEGSNTLKGNQFISNISHEFRTPLTAIIGFSEILKNDTKLSDEQREKAEIIHSTGSHLLQIISDVLDLSKIESGKIKFEKNKIRLSKLCDDIDRMITVRFNERKELFKIVYHFPLPDFVIGDLTRIKQVVINLCSNAMKFTERGTVEMHIEYEGDKLSISVKDSGLGIPLHKQDSVFKEFEQVDNSNSRKYAGTGLGLPISKRLCQGMGGDLVLVESAPHKGSTFKACIIAELAEDAQILNKFEANVVEEDDAMSNIPNLQGKKMLVADDNEINRKLVEMYLSKTNIEMSFVENGLEAYEHLVENEVDIALLDIQMPVMTGIESIARIRDAGIDIPVIAFTASVTFAELDEYRRKGFTAILGKPINTKWFYKIIAENIEKHNKSDS